MAIDTNTSLTFDIIGMREDLGDVIFNISPTETPFMGMIGKTKATNTTHEWLTDRLATAGSNAALEGDSFVGDSLSAASRLNNTCQISKKQIEIAGTLVDGVTLAGRNNEYAYQARKASKALKRDMEWALTNNQAVVTQSGANSTTARVLRPLTGWYTTNTVNVGAGGSNGSTSAARTDGTQAAMTEATLKSLIAKVWQAGGEPDTVMVGPFNKGVISGFGGPTGTQRMNVADKKILYASISVYDSDFGELSITPRHFQRDRDVHLLDTNYWKLAISRNFRIEDLAKTGDAYRGQILVEYTLEASNQAASGLLADATTS